MDDLQCFSVLGHDDLVHALDGNGYCLCGMGRKVRGEGDIRATYSNDSIGCLMCLMKIADGYRQGSVWIHYGI